MQCKASGTTSSTRIFVLSHLVIPDGVAHVEGVVLEAVLGLNTLLVLLILALVLLSLLDHALDLVLAETTLVVGDDDLVLDVCAQ